jgi:phage antirepressor YoqD-like protein
MKNKFWDNIQYPLNEETLINQDVINKSINDFWKQIIKKIKPNNHILILFRVRTGDHYLTLGYLQKLNLEDKEYFQKYINNIFSLKEDSYKQIYINEIIISYGVREGVIIRTEIKQTTNFLSYKHFKLPITMNPLEYGYVIFQSDQIYIIGISRGTIATIETNLSGINDVKIHRDHMLAFKYKDIYIDQNKFKRILNNRTYIYSREDENQDFSLELLRIEKPARFITIKKKDMNQNDKIITLDIETYKNDSKSQEGGQGGLTPYLISWFDGNKHQSYFLKDYNSPEEMITKALSDLKRPKYHNHKVYIHNLAGFDGYFIIKELSNLGILTPIIHDGKIISLKLSFSNANETKYFSLLFLDSLQLLLTGLKKLCKAFNLDIDKGLFPHKFITANNLSYIGAIPSYDQFINLKYDEYEEYSKLFNDDWSLRDEAIKYCQRDCLTLYQIMNKFNDLMFNNLHIDMTKYPTISSLAMALFRMHYLNEDTKIAMISGQVYDFMRQSYTGGSTDMFIPTNLDNELVYGYDVNSLYPYVMANCKLPSGKPTYFEGDITLHDKEAFGFFYCKVNAPKDLLHPIIQLHIKTKGGIRTIAPTGTFETMLFSEEMNNAIKLGYTFEILWGYTFEKQYIFKDYVESLYNMRLTYSKDNPMNYICKILMNSLYGKFGMNDLFDTCIVIENENLDKAIGNNLVKEVIEIGDNFIVKTERDKSSTYLDNASETHNVNISIASAITAYSRIYMSQFKNNPNLKLFYTDTDSIYTNLSPEEMNKLYPDMISSKGIGKLKLESVSKKAIFLAPKVYYLNTVDDHEIFKVKGLKKDVTLSKEEFESLLFKETILIKNQDKWFKSISNGNIEIKPTSYSLKQTDNKRKLIFEGSMLVNTSPYNVVANKLVT